MTENTIKEIVEGIKEAADEILEQEKRDSQDYGQLLAYAEALSIIRDACGPDAHSKIGLDFDIDAKYLS